MQHCNMLQIELSDWIRTISMLNLMCMHVWICNIQIYWWIPPFNSPMYLLCWSTDAGVDTLSHDRKISDLRVWLLPEYVLQLSPALNFWTGTHNSQMCWKRSSLCSQYQRQSIPAEITEWIQQMFMITRCTIYYRYSYVLQVSQVSTCQTRLSYVLYFVFYQWGQLKNVHT